MTPEEIAKIQEENQKLKADHQNLADKLDSREKSLAMLRREQQEAARVAQEYAPPVNGGLPYNQTNPAYATEYESTEARLARIEDQQRRDGEERQKERKQAIFDRQQTQLRQFKTDNQAWSSPEKVDELKDFINNDPEGFHKIWDPQTGEYDYYRSYTSALRDMKLRALEAQAKKPTPAQRKNDINQATIAGDGSVPAAEEVDVSKLSSRQMVEMGLVEEDPSDPYHFDQQPTGPPMRK